MENTINVLHKVAGLKAKNDDDKAAITEAFNAAAEDIMAEWPSFDKGKTIAALDDIMDSDDTVTKVRVGATELLAEIACREDSTRIRDSVKSAFDIASLICENDDVKAAVTAGQQKLQRQEMTEVRALTQAIKGKYAR